MTGMGAANRELFTEVSSARQTMTVKQANEMALTGNGQGGE
jgi:hypothetical protein